MSFTKLNNNDPDEDSQTTQINKAYEPAYELDDINSLANPSDIVSIAWKNLRCEVTNGLRRNKITILRRLNGYLTYHSLNGFLGPSGAGKTTLLNCLNGINRSGMSSDSELYMDRDELKIPMIRFIEQHVQETMIAKMSVGEILRYAFSFKNERKYSYKMEKHIGMVLDELLLDEAILENRFENCSGGEQRRVAIAQELMSLDKPSFLFIDEPTTGLDSNAAFLVMKCLRRLADNNRMTILVSIHSPNSDIINLFDKIYILAKGGVCIYSDSPKYLLNKLDEQIGRRLDEDKPPIEEYLKIACNGIGNENVRKMADLTLEEEHKRLLPHIQNGKLKFLPEGILIGHKAFQIGDLLLQMIRMFHIVFIVEYKKLLFQLLMFTILFTVMATLFDHKIIKAKTCYSFQAEENENFTCRDKLIAESYTEEYKLYQMFFVAGIGFSIIGISTLMFSTILKVFINEHKNRWYSMGVFYWSFVLTRLLDLTVVAVYISLVTYFTMEHTAIDNYTINWLRVGHFIFFIWIISIFLQSYGHMLSLIFLGQVEISIVAGILTFICLQFFSGYLFNLQKLKIGIIDAATELITFKFASNGLIYSIWGLERCSSENEISFVLDDFGVNVDTVYSDLVYICIHTVIVRTITFLLMVFRFSINFSRRKFFQFSEQEIKLIDYGNEKHSTELANIDLNKITRIKEQNELMFEDFSRDKIIIAWRSVTLFVSKSIYEIRLVGDDNLNHKKLILRNLNGQFQFGTLNALMGPSGAGKTSLLKVLNGQMKTRLSDESSFYLSKFTPIRGCYITQEVSGHLLPGLTAKQSLIYASKLKNINEDSNQLDHEQIAMNILNELDLSETKDTFVQNCSGGQRKRLALGLELTALRMPNLICIDEPTSGLDSNSAEVVMACLLKVARTHNITIISSIHQPNTKLMMMFDQVYVLAKGGVCVYSGKPTDIRQHLSQVSDQMNNPEIFPVEELLKYSCLNHTDQTVEELVQSTRDKILSQNQCLMEQVIPVKDGIPLNRNRFSMLSVYVLLLRWLSYLKGYLWLHMVIFSMIYLFYGFMLPFFFLPKIAYRSGCVNIEDGFNDTCNRTEEKEEEKFDLTTNFTYNMYYNNLFLFLVMMQTSVMFSKEIKFFLNEHRNGWYSTGAFYLMKMIVEIFHMFIIIFLYTYLIDIYEPVKPGIYIWLVFFINLSSITIHGLSHLIAMATSGDFFTMTASLPSVCFFSMMIGNLGTPVPRLHYIYKFLANFSPYRFAIEGALILQYGFDRCGPREIQAVLFRLWIEHDEYLYFVILMLFVNAVLYHSLALIVLLIKTNPYEDRRRRAQKITNYHQTMLKPSNVIIPGLGCDQQFSIKRIEI